MKRVVNETYSSGIIQELDGLTGRRRRTMSPKRYYTADKPPALLGGSPPAATAIFLIAFGAVFAVMVFSGSEKIAFYSALWMSRVVEGDFWRVITAPFFFGFPQRIEVLSALGSGVVLWLFGCMLEKWWSTKRLLIFFLICTYGGHIVSGLVAWAVWPMEPVGGISPGAVALAVAGSLVFRYRGLGIAFRGRIYGLDWWLVLAVTGGIIILGSIVDLIEGQPIASQIGNLTGGGIAYLFVTEEWRFWKRRKRSVKSGKGNVVDFTSVKRGGGGRGGFGTGRGSGSSGREDDPYRWN